MKEKYQKCHKEQIVRCYQNCDDGERRECKRMLQKQQISDTVFSLLKGYEISVSAMFEILEKVQKKILDYSKL